MNPQDDVKFPSDDWSKWSNHVLKELNRLNENYQKLSDQLNEFKESVFNLDRHDIEIKELTKEIEALKDFKIQAVTVWSVIQFGVLIASYFIAKG